jgi:hypothetical protein
MDVREPPSDAMTAVVYIASFTTLAKIGIGAARTYHP